MKQSHRYDDIIHLPHHVSAKRAPMSLTDRAAQFSPFAALTGYEAVIEETGRLTDMQIELDEGAKAMLDEAVGRILEDIHNQPLVRITWFRPDERKLGGAYVSVTGRIKKIDEYRQVILLTDDTVIPLGQVYSMEILE